MVNTHTGSKRKMEGGGAVFLPKFQKKLGLRVSTMLNCSRMNRCRKMTAQTCAAGFAVSSAAAGSNLDLQRRLLRAG